MAVSTGSNAVALQYERVRDKISLLYPRESVFADLIERVENDLVSTRAMRLPVQMKSGSQFAQTGFAGDDLGVGTASDYEVFQTTPVGFVQSTAWSLDSMFATEKAGSAQGKDQAVASYTKRELKNALKEFACYQDVVSQGDSTGSFDAVVSYTAGPPIILGISNANRFRINNTYQMFQGATSTQRTRFQVTGVDQLGGQVYITIVNGFGSGTPTIGDSIGFVGTTNTAGTSINGLAYIQSDPGNSGVYAGLNRSDFPGRLRTPHTNAAGPITAEVGRAAIQKMRAVLGAADKLKDFKWYMGLDQEQAIEAVSVQTQSVILNQLKGETSEDPIKFDAPKSFVGRPIKVSTTAAPGRIDGLKLDHWVKSSVLKGGGDPQPLQWNGNTEFPMYGTSGGLTASTLTYLINWWQMISDNPAAGVYIDGLTVPSSLSGLYL